MRLGILLLFIGLSLACETEQQVNKPNVNADKTSTVNTNKNVNVNKPDNSNNQTSGKVPVYTYEVVKTYKHDQNAFTQGLFFHNGFLYESTGQQGDSSIRKVEIETGKILQKFDLPKDSFGEGATIFGNKIYQLTWQEGVCRVFDAESFNLLKEFNYAGEGWGITNDDKNLIMSDGTHVIRFVDPETFKTVRTITTFDEDGKPLMDINELELIKGEIWANVWHSENIGKPNHVARIDPQTGKLLGWIDLDKISPDDVSRTPENTLNGIAYDPSTDRIFVTGKMWRKLFEIKIKPKQ